MADLRGLSSAAQILLGGLYLVVFPNDQYQAQSRSTFSSMTWMKRQCTLSKFADDTKL